MKKIMLLVAVAGLVGMSSCAYKTCPTYAKKAQTVQPAKNNM